jgi:hypothetical protein
MLQFQIYARLHNATDMTDTLKRIWNATKKIALFGLFCGIGIVAAGAGVIWYSDRPEPNIPSRSWEELKVPAQGIKYHLKTEWQDGETRYIFEVLPLNKSLSDAFDAVLVTVGSANAGTYTFEINARDANEFEVCSIDISVGTGSANGQMGDADTGKIYELEFQGSTSSCPRKQYLEAGSFSVFTNFPKVEISAAGQPTK